MMKQTVMPALLSLCISLMVLLPSMASCDFHWIYPLDDAYIHIALARQVAENGIWGIQPGEYAFCSSSPLWTVLLALFYLIFGIQEWLPGVLSIVLNMCSAIVLFRILTRYKVNFTGSVVALLFIMFTVPFAATSAVGMEHSLHVFTMIVFVDFAELLLSGNKKSSRVLLYAFGALAVATRFESLALVLPFVLFFWISGERKTSAVLCAVAILPVLAYGCIAKSHGGFFLPNSVMLKACLPDQGGFFDRIYSVWRNTSWRNIHMYSLVLSVLVLCALKNTPKTLKICGICVTICIVGHVLFAKTGNLFRYETHIVAVGTIVIALAVYSNYKDFKIKKLSDLNNLILVSSGILLLAPLFLRGWVAIKAMSDASRNIYGQQVQLARFFAALPENQRGTIAINDLGYMSLHSGAKILDVWGLGSQEVTGLRMNNAWDNEHKELLFNKHNVRYVAVFNEWFPYRVSLPEHLIPVGKLRCVPATICPSEDVWLYGTTPKFADYLRSHIENVCSNNLLNLPNGTSFVLFK